jgi:hypothetical protein
VAVVSWEYPECDCGNQLLPEPNLAKQLEASIVLQRVKDLLNDLRELAPSPGFTDRLIHLQGRADHEVKAIERII